MDISILRHTSKTKYDTYNVRAFHAIFSREALILKLIQRRCLVLEVHYKALVQSVRKTLESGSSICIVGWIGKNHCRFTKELSEKKVTFLENPSRSIPQNAGLVLCTRYMSHGAHKRIKKKGDTYPVAIPVRKIRKILESCSDLLCPSAAEHA